MLQRRQPHRQAALIKVLQLAKWKKKKIPKQKKNQLVGDIQILLNYGRNTRGTRIYFFLPLAVMVLGICPPASQQDTSQTSQTLKPRSPHVWFWWQFHEGFRVTNFRFSNHDQPTRNAFRPVTRSLPNKMASWPENPMGFPHTCSKQSTPTAHCLIPDCCFCETSLFPEPFPTVHATRWL